MSSLGSGVGAKGTDGELVELVCFEADLGSLFVFTGVRTVVILSLPDLVLLVSHVTLTQPRSIRLDMEVGEKTRE